MNDCSFEHVLSEHYTVFDGLGGMHIEDLYQDREGFLWVATADGGVSRFDSVHFDRFSRPDGLPHLTVMAMAEADDERLLFGTFGGGLAAYDGRGFQVYTTEHGLPSNQIVGLQAQPDGSVLVLTGAGVAWFADGRCIRSLTEVGGQPLGRVYDMATDAAGTTWLATWERGIVSVDGRRMALDDQAIRHPWKFAQTADGHLWIAFQSTNPATFMGRYDPHAEQLVFIPMDDIAPQGARNGVRHVRTDAHDRLWVASRGVLVHDGQTWQSFCVDRPEVDFSGVRLTYEDREGNVWLGLWGGGLIFCDPVSIRSYTEADGLPDREVCHLGEDGAGRLWIGTMGGMACMEAGQIRSLGESQPVSALMVDSAGQVWSGGKPARCTSGRARRHRRLRWRQQATRKKSPGCTKMSTGVSGLVRSQGAWAG